MSLQVGRCYRYRSALDGELVFLVLKRDARRVCLCLRLWQCGLLRLAETFTVRASGPFASDSQELR